MNCLPISPVFIADLCVFLSLFCGLLASITLFLLDLIVKDSGDHTTKKRMKLRDRLHFAMTQSRGFE